MAIIVAHIIIIPVSVWIGMHDWEVKFWDTHFKIALFCEVVMILGFFLTLNEMNYG